MSEIELRVTPETLRQKAGEFTDLVRAMRSHATAEVDAADTMAALKTDIIGEDWLL